MYYHNSGVHQRGKRDVDVTSPHRMDMLYCFARHVEKHKRQRHFPWIATTKFCSMADSPPCKVSPWFYMLKRKILCGSSDSVLGKDFTYWNFGERFRCCTTLKPSPTAATAGDCGAICRFPFREEFAVSLEHLDLVPLVLLLCCDADTAMSADSNDGSGCARWGWLQLFNSTR